MNDANDAKDFVVQLENGNVPSIISDLPMDVFDAFRGLIGILNTLPSQVVNEAEATITEASRIFDDIANGKADEIPGVIASDITSEWAAITSGVGGGWNDFTDGAACFFNPNGCHTSSSCAEGSPTPGPVRQNNAATTPTAGNYGSYSGTYESNGSTRVRQGGDWTFLGLCAVAGLGFVGVVVVL